MPGVGAFRDGMGGLRSRGLVDPILEHARRERPLLGICLGMQVAMIEFARNVAGMAGDHSTEIDTATPYPVIALITESMDERGEREHRSASGDLGGTIRLGEQLCHLAPESLAARVYGSASVRERHRHRFEVNNAYVDRLKRAGMVVSGVNPRRNLVEVIELKGHPWFVATQAHPEFQSKPSKAHPLFAAFIGAALRGTRKRPARRARQ